MASRQVGDLPNTPHRTSLKIANEYNVGRRTIERNAQFAKVVDILPESKKEEVLNQGEKISYPIADKILKMDKPTQKKFIKEVEGGTPIKERDSVLIALYVNAKLRWR